MKKNAGQGSHLFVTDTLRWLLSVVISIAIILGSSTVYNRFKPATPDETLTGSAQGLFAEVTVVIGLKDGKILEIEATEAGETPELGGAAIAQYNENYLASLVGMTIEDIDPSAIDAVSGSTVTSNAFISALKQAAGIEEEVPAEEAPAEEAPAEEAAPVEEAAVPADAAAIEGAVDGTYTATAKGFGGDIVADVTIKDGMIADVKLTGDQETPTLGGVAVEKMPARIVAAQALDIDGIAGATVSSTAIKAAVKDALSQANIDADSLHSVAAAGDAAKTEETIDVDVVVVGAGGAGMAAAITAKQAGKNVVVLEKMPYVGGNTSKASGGMNAAGTKEQEAAIAAETDEKVKESLEGSTVENFIIDTMNGGHQLNNPDLVRTMAEKSADAVEWLASVGAPLPKIAATGGTVHMYLHEPEDGSAVGDYLVSVFSAKLGEMDIPVMLDTKATELISEDGKVTGVKAESEDKLLTINAKAVILATGGFGANEEMYCSYRPDLKGTVTTNAPGATGDGIVMAEAVGADLVDIDQIQLHPTVFQENGFLVSERLRSNGAILVNINGQRFTNDLSTRDAVSAAELEQPECCAFIVYDSQYAEEKLYQKYVSNGLTTEGATLEELAANIGFDAAATENFIATVNAWNDTVNNGTDDPFGRNNGLVALEKAPYYAIKIAPGIHHCMGGLKIDTDTHVINTNGEAIPGLFAAGEVTGGVHGGNRIGGNAVADIVVYGRIAGANACTYADGGAQEASAEAAAETLTGSATGMGEVIVTLTIEDGKITSAVAEGANETPGLGAAMIEGVNNGYFTEIVGKSVEEIDPSAIDVVSGSTLTSNAVIEALTQAIGTTSSAPAEEAAPAEAAAETLTGSATGMGEVTVTLTIEDGKITSVVAEGANETPGLGAAMIEGVNNGYFTDIIGKSVEEIDPSAIDVISGSTLTSNAVIEALSQAIGTTSSAPAEEAAPAEAAAETLTGSATGMGEVTVTLTIEDGKITSVVAEGANETPGLGAAMIEGVNNGYFTEIVGKSVEEIDPSAIDVISGSTLTSNAVIEALSQAIGA